MRQLAPLLRERDFRWLFVSQAISMTGDRIVTVALALLVVQQTGRASDLGIVLAAHAIPLVGFLLIGGVWADRLPRQRIMVVTDLVRFGLHATLAALILAGTVEIWQIVVIEVCFGAAEAFFRPAYTALVPQTVPEELIQEANGLNGVSQTLAEFLGPALATALVVTVGVGIAFVVDASTFLLSAALLLLVRPRPRGVPAERSTLLRELRDGYREVRSRSWVWVTIVVFAFALLCGLAPYFVLGPIVAEDQFGDEAIYGVVAAALGAGTVIGSLLGIRWRPERPMRAAFVAVLPWVPMLLLFGLGAPLPLVLAGAAVAGFGFALFGVWWETALAQRIPPAALSRVTSYDWMGSLALLPIGYLLAGALAELLGASTVLCGGAGLTLIALLLGFVPRETRELRRVDASPEAARVDAEAALARAGAPLDRVA